MRHYLLLCWLMVGWTAFSAHGVVIRHDRLDSDALAAGSSFESVGMVGVMGYWWGSGTMIHPEWMLTAGHCMYDSAGNLQKEIWVNVAGKSIQADRWIVHEQYDNATDPSGWDIALIHLTSPAVWAPTSSLYTGTLTHGTEVAFAGYGGYGNGETGYVGYDDKLRAAWNVVDGFGGDDVPVVVNGLSGNLSEYPSNLFCIDFDEPGQGNGLFGGAALDFEGNTAPGDSGGGWFVEEDGEYYLTGVTSGGFISNAGYGDLSYNVSTAFFNDWIMETIPEPSVMGSLCVGAGILFIRRRFS